MKAFRYFFSLVMILLAAGTTPAGAAGGTPAPLDPFELFLNDQRGEIARECDFSGKSRAVVHEAAWARFKGVVERRLRREGSEDLRARWALLAAMAPSELSRTPEFSGLLRSYASARYSSDLVRIVTELVRCRTIENGVVPVSENPAFRRCTAIVDSLAREHEFEFSVLADGLALELAFGSGPDTLGIWSHLDVVPADSAGWSVDPWVGAVKDGRIEARGVEDDKGPFAASLLALRAFRDTGVPLVRRVMLFAGYAEETTFADIDGYLKVRPAPSMNVVVDGAFPVIVAEKGMTTITVASSFSRAPMRLCRTGYIIRGLKGGTVSNQVPDHAEIRLYSADKGAVAAFHQVSRRVSEFNQNNSRARLTARRDGDDVVVTAEGKAAHGSTPESGHNAIVDIAQFVSDNGMTCPNPPHWILMFIQEFVGEDHAGRGLGIAAKDSVMGPTTVNVGFLSLEMDSVYVKLDIRFPVGQTPDTILETIRERIRDYDTQFKAGLAVTRRGTGLLPIRVDENGALVRTLLESYEEVYRNEGRPASIAGTTYAKCIPNAVSFGPALPGEVRAHTSGEFMTVTELDDLLRVYTTAFFRLASR